MENYKLYVHIFPNDKLYFGITNQEPSKRWQNGYGYKNQPKIYKAINDFGWNNIEHIILYDSLSDIEAQELEKKYIEEFDSIKNGYNISVGGGLGGNEWKHYEYNGKILTPSQLEKIANKNITSHDITTRMSRGWDIERALNQEKHKKILKYEYKNKMYSIDELYEMKNVDITRRQLLDRLRRGWETERALNQPKGKKNQPYINKYEYNNNYYTTKELCNISNIVGITEKHIRERINRGWTIERAITQPLRNKK